MNVLFGGHRTYLIHSVQSLLWNSGMDQWSWSPCRTWNFQPPSGPKYPCWETRSRDFFFSSSSDQHHQLNSSDWKQKGCNVRFKASPVEPRTRPNKQLQTPLIFGAKWMGFHGNFKWRTLNGGKFAVCACSAALAAVALCTVQSKKASHTCTAEHFILQESTWSWSWTLWAALDLSLQL